MGKEGKMKETVRAENCLLPNSSYVKGQWKNEKSNIGHQ